jgi:hypothetical protein
MRSIKLIALMLGSAIGIGLAALAQVPSGATQPPSYQLSE